MSANADQGVSKQDLLLHWLVFGALLASLSIYLVIGYILGPAARVQAANSEPVLLRSIFYALAIATFPLINLLRHICLRLNQTMPTAAPAKSRYLVSVVISLALAESIAVYGLVLALLGDSVNSLWIFTFMALLAMFLYRPKFSEYQSIVSALTQQPRSPPNVR